MTFDANKLHEFALDCGFELRSLVTDEDCWYSESEIHPWVSAPTTPDVVISCGNDRNKLGPPGAPVDDCDQIAVTLTWK